VTNYSNSTFKRKAAKPTKRSKLSRVSKTPITKLKKKLWQLCRSIIIKRYGNTCYPCGAFGLSGSNLHIGHFIPSSVCSAAVRYDLENLRPSCYRCNIHLSGNWPAYEEHLKRDGIDVEALKQHNRDTQGMKADNVWYEAKISEYEGILEELQLEK